MLKRRANFGMFGVLYLMYSGCPTFFVLAHQRHRMAQSKARWWSLCKGVFEHKRSRKANRCLWNVISHTVECQPDESIAWTTPTGAQSAAGPIHEHRYARSPATSGNFPPTDGGTPPSNFEPQRQKTISHTLAYNLEIRGH